MTDFSELLYRLLPGIYRQQDGLGELRQMLEILAQPPAELEQSIGQLYLDLFVESCRTEFLPLIGGVIGEPVDTSEPGRIQRAALASTFAFLRSRGLAGPLARVAQEVSTWTTVPVDFSQRVARLPFIDALDVIARRRGQPAAEDPIASGRFLFDTSRRVAPLYDKRRGRPIARTELVPLGGELIGTDAGFSIFDRGIPLVGTAAPVPLTVLAADLSDFDHPRDPANAALTIAAGQIAIDPALGRFVINAPRPLVANVTVDFHTLTPGVAVPETFDIRDSARMARLGRADDPAPYTLDFRSPKRPAETIGRTFYDNHGLFLTVGQTVANQRPNLVRPGAFSGFTFDARPLAAGDTAGVTLQLQDGIDGSPITRAKLAGNEPVYFDAARGFTISDLATSLRDPAFPTTVRLVAADLTDLTNPRAAVGGAPLTLAATDVAIDPQRGRFLVNLSAIGLTAERVRVSYLLAPATRTVGATPLALGPALFAFAPDGGLNPLRDAFDGTPLAVKLRLGATIAEFHGTTRGYRVLRDGADVTGALAAELVALDDPAITASVGHLAVDLDRGRFALPAGLLQPGDAIAVEFSAEDLGDTDRAFQRLAQRLPRMMPAGVVPVLIDTRRAHVDPSTLT